MKNKMKIKLYRTPMGDIIAMERKVENGVYFLEKVLSFKVGQNAQGVEVGFGSIAAFAEDATNDDPSINIEMPSEHVIFSYIPKEEVVEAYVAVVDGTPKNAVLTTKKPKLVV